MVKSFNNTDHGSIIFTAPMHLLKKRKEILYNYLSMVEADFDEHTPFYAALNKELEVVRWCIRANKRINK